MHHLQVDSQAPQAPEGGIADVTLEGPWHGGSVAVYLEVHPQVGTGHVLGATYVTYEALVPEVYGAHVTGHVLVGLEGGIAVLAGEAPCGAVGAAVVLIEAALVEGFVALVAAEAALVGVQYHVVLVCLQALEALVAHLAHMVPLPCVHFHVPLEVVQSGPLVITLVTLVAARRPVLQNAVHVQTPLLTEGLATCRTLVLRVPGGGTRVDLLLMHTGLQQTAKPLVTIQALVFPAVQKIGPTLTI